MKIVHGCSPENAKCFDIDLQSPRIFLHGKGSVPLPRILLSALQVIDINKTKLANIAWNHILLRVIPLKIDTSNLHISDLPSSKKTAIAF